MKNNFSGSFPLGVTRLGVLGTFVGCSHLFCDDAHQPRRSLGHEPLSISGFFTLRYWVDDNAR